MAVTKPKKPALPKNRYAKHSLPQLKKSLTTAFNMWVRLRDTVDGFGNCISCGANKPFAELDAGHFVPSNYTVHRWDVTNVNAQCHRCNRFMHGNLIGYFIGMEKKYGAEVPRELETTKHTLVKFSRGELELLIQTFKDRVKELQK